MVSVLDSGVSDPDLSPGQGHCVVFLARHFTLPVPLSTQVYKWVPANCWGNLTNCWGVTCDGLTSHPGEQKYSKLLHAKGNFTITAEIYERSLANFYCQIDVSFWCVCPVIDSEFRPNIVKVVCGSTWLSPHGSTATLTKLWWNSWSIKGQMHEKPMIIC